MKKTLTLIVLTAFVALPSFARYVVVLRDGTRYVARQKWTVVNGKAIVQLENGQSLQLDPSLIDVPRSERDTKMGLTNANVIDLNPAATTAQPKQQPSLGDTIKLRRNTPAPAQAAPKQAPSAPAPVSGPGQLPGEVLDKFSRAFENLGIFEKKLTSSGARSLRAEVTVDTEDRVFNAISATSYLMVRNAGVDGAQIDMVELFMRTTTGGSAGRFQMSRADAEALDKKRISQQEYFIRKVIY
ncbi:MAG TPA: hypothetical protein VF883_18575 [Thermoanaerobaculia bacterium]|jgi:hypothetical protein